MATDPRLAIQQHLAWCARAYGSELALALPEVSPPEAERTDVAAHAARPAEMASPQAGTAPEAGTAPQRAPRPESAPARPARAVPSPETPAAREPEPPAERPAVPPGPARGRDGTPFQEGAKEHALQQLRQELAGCTRCKLSQGRQHVVFGEGNPDARVLFVGEAPGAREDQTGRPFVGPAGQLLDRILNGAMGLQRSDVYIANINKCRPPGNRAPEADEVAACLPFLRRQVEILAPQVIVCLGRTAAQNLLGSTESTTALRGREHSYAGIPVVVTWHPAYLLRDPSRKRETWEDIKRVNRLLGLPEVPPTGV